MRTYWALGATLLLLLVTLGSVWSIAHAAPPTAALPAPHSAPHSAPPAAPAAEPAMSHAALPPAAAPAQRGEPSTCTGYDRETGLNLQSRTVEPNDILDCETSAVSLTVGADCDKVPLHVVLNVDRSGSMVGQPIEEVKAAARALVQALDMERPEERAHEDRARVARRPGPDRQPAYRTSPDRSRAGSATCEPAERTTCPTPLPSRTPCSHRTPGRQSRRSRSW